ncbi:MAG: homoserine dehydrogenase, partial [Oscillospiraceae bacterium]|nr:homoserine dehydrogenase [Oscillospiraceae bacterium]
ILASLCYGKAVDPDKVRTEGIKDISLDDIAIASKIGCRVKLLGRAMPDGHGGVVACAAPHLVPSNRLISGVDGVMNAIAVQGNATGESLFYGPGAGKLPTASAVVADIMDIVSRGADDSWKAPWGEADEGYVSDFDQVVSKWYIRAEHASEPAAEDMEFIGSSGGFDGFITEPADRAQAVEMAKALKVKAMYRVLS